MIAIIKKKMTIIALITIFRFKKEKISYKICRHFSPQSFLLSIKLVQQEKILPIMVKQKNQLQTAGKGSKNLHQNLLKWFIDTKR